MPKLRSLTLFVTLTSLILPSARSADTSARVAISASTRGDIGMLWRDPADIATRDLYYGPGGERNQPHSPFTFVEEDLNGTNPKYVVRDRDNVKWTVKLGLEARPETAATRLVWAVGYFTDEDYFVSNLQITGMPAHLKRGGKLVAPDGWVQNVRLKRHLEGEKNTGDWKWNDNPFIGARELNGLKVMMALVNNWDLKDVNNKIFAGKGKEGKEAPIYKVSDLGASFGTTGFSFPFSHSKGDLKSYTDSKFITNTNAEYVNFQTPSRPSFIYLTRPLSWFERVRLDSRLHRIPRDDARWMGDMLSRLSPDQIRDAFRAAGYSQDDVEAFANVVAGRITQLCAL